MIHLVHDQVADSRGEALDALPSGQLMGLVCRDQRAAFEVLVRRHEPAVRRYLARMVGGVDALDLSQEVFLELWRRRTRYTERGRFTVLLYRVARNKALSRLRWRKVRRLLGPESGAAEQAAHDVRDGLRVLLAAERAQRLDQAVASLPLGLREALVLRYGEGLDYDTASRLTGVRPGALRTRAHRALALLRQDLQRQEEP